ncbi:unnamed protein product [Rangifer tarandus platyrhynchus]|uniref:Uncharacterized protein n=1 Tax=Rangifer tarandus platyrhynchus TaxID=3082113 RepID=A0AC59YD65_RANTA
MPKVGLLQLPASSSQGAAPGGAGRPVIMGHVDQASGPLSGSAGGSLDCTPPVTSRPFFPECSAQKSPPWLSGPSKPSRLPEAASGDRKPPSAPVFSAAFRPVSENRRFICSLQFPSYVRVEAAGEAADTPAGLTRRRHVPARHAARCGGDEAGWVTAVSRRKGLGGSAPLRAAGHRRRVGRANESSDETWPTGAGTGRGPQETNRGTAESARLGDWGATATEGKQ